jgi:hypothetical protein
MRFTSFSEYREITIYIVLFRLSSARRHVFWIPHFVDAAANDFHLRSDSSAIAAGTTDGVPVGKLDLEGSPRVESGNVDIGCYQRK